MGDNFGLGTLKSSEKAQDRLIESLNALYDRGKECNWKVPDEE